MGILDVYDSIAFDAKWPNIYPLQLLAGHGFDRISPYFRYLHCHLCRKVETRRQTFTNFLLKRALLLTRKNLYQIDKYSIIIFI